MFSRLITYLRLPAEVSSFEKRYLQKVNRLTAWFFLLHVPAFVLIAALNDTGAASAFVLTSAVAAGPIAAYRLLSNPRTVTLVYGFAAMLMGGLLVHYGQGPVQIEMHFYFFALLAMLALYGNPAAILVAAATVTVHHLLLWAYLPSSVFNYDAPWWVVMVHAAFVVLESAAAIFIARSFFDNVIGLEKIVQSRTAELDASNRAMHLVLDSIDQALMTLDANGTIAAEYSAATARWFGEPEVGQTLWDFLEPHHGDFAFGFELAFQQCVDGFLPLDVAIAQAPSRLEVGDSLYQVRYKPLQSTPEAPLDGMLVVVSDITDEVARQRLEMEQRDIAALIDRLVRDRAGVIEFVTEADGLVAAIAAGHTVPRVLKRALHTLKGNSLVYGLQTIGAQAHAMEALLVEEQHLPDLEIRRLVAQWTRLRDRLSALLGERTENIEVELARYQDLLQASLDQLPHETITQLLVGLRLEPTALRLARIRSQACELAQRLGKEGLDVVVEDSAMSLHPGHWSSFWSSFVHVIRNAIDHGIESVEERVAAGKQEVGRLTLRTVTEAGMFVVEVVDDGRGINWDAVRQAAQRRDLPHDTPTELTDALFAPGLSTATGVTEYSGRGVGMTALRDACRERGGHITVESIKGRGTTVRFQFPSDAVAVSATEFLQERFDRPAAA